MRSHPLLARPESRRRAGAKLAAVLSSIVIGGWVASGCSADPGTKKVKSISSTSTTKPPVPNATPTTLPTVPANSVPAGASPCTSSDLSVALGQGNGAAGTVYFPLTFTNTGGKLCSLDGYPGISLVGSHGNQIGPPAGRAPLTSPAVVALTPGQSTVDTVALSDTINECSNPERTSGLRVYPPNQTAALFAPSTQIGFCSSDEGSPLTVYPIGDNQFG
jgi:hypothetical protein